jgi:hypothetical protein
MRFVFLDIDGVLATEECSYKPNHELYAYPFDNECVNIFNEILSKTDAEIILTSDWRLMFQDLETLDLLFKHNGIIKSPISVTSDLSSRAKEIETYINTNQINSFVIIDDMDLKIFPDRFVRCNINEGIKQDGIKEKITVVLNN